MNLSSLLYRLFHPRIARRLQELKSYRMNQVDVPSLRIVSQTGRSQMRLAKFTRFEIRSQFETSDSRR